MFHEIFLAPFTQTEKFRSPDVGLLPFVSGSTHAVMTTLWTPGRCVVLVAPAIAVTAANRTTAPSAGSFLDGDFIPRLLPGLSQGRMIRSSDLGPSERPLAPFANTPEG
jgi:hypothetical protein